MAADARLGLTVGAARGGHDDLCPKALALLPDAVIVSGHHCSQDTGMLGRLKSTMDW